MLRQTTRFLAPAYRSLARPAPSATRTIPSTTRSIRIRSSDSQPTQPSPAPNPPKVPEGIKGGSGFESEVNAPGTVAGSGVEARAGQAEELSGSVSEPGIAGTPLEPPHPSTPLPKSASTPEATETVNENPDYTALPSLDIDPSLPTPSIAEPQSESEAEGGPKKRTGAGKKEYVTSMEKQRRMWIRAGYGLLLVGGAGVIFGMGSGEKTEGAQVESQGMFTTAKKNLSELFDIFNKPAFTTLLPDPLPPPHQRPYTLVIDLEGLLVHSSWDRVHGWRTAKRPGVDYFLGYLSQFYEIVLFTSQPLYTAAPVAEKIDPYQAFMPYRLFRESTRHVNGKVVKDLTYLNRDPSKVVVLDTNAEHVSLQPENGIVVKPWEGERGDKGLVDMIPFLESIGIFAPADVRPILQAYTGKDIPVEYAKKEAEAKAKAVEEWERSHPAGSGIGGGFLGSMFGSVAAPGSSRPNQPMTYLEQKRAQAQHIYREEQKYWVEHADEFKKMIEEDKQRQLAEMKGSLLGYLGAPKPTDGPKEEVHKA